MTYAEMFEAAMKVETREAAEELLAAMVAIAQEVRGSDPEVTRKSVLRDLAYYAGYHSHETRLRVEDLFNCVHPYLGPAKDGPLTAEQIFRMGMAIGRQANGESDADS